METQQVNSIGKKRIRNGPGKIWSKQEEGELLDFLKDNRNFEKPSAQVYYNKFLNNKCIDVQWSLVRSKVRNMRTKYNKAKAFENSTGAGTLREGETMKDVLNRMCYFYEDFDDIFNNKNVENATLNETLVLEEILDITNEGDDPSPTLPSPSVSIHDQVVKKGIYSRTALSEIIARQDTLVEFKNKKFEEDLKLKREIFEFEQKKSREELLLREKEIESNERIKMYEIKMNTELAMKQLEMQSAQHI